VEAAGSVPATSTIFPAPCQAIAISGMAAVCGRGDGRRMERNAPVPTSAAPIHSAQCRPFKKWAGDVTRCWKTAPRMATPLLFHVGLLLCTDWSLTNENKKRANY